jgi:signal peptidase I
MVPALRLYLADGQLWLIRPVDELAAAIVAELGDVMRLGSACGSGRPGEGGRELCVAVCAESERLDLEASGAVVCRLAAPTGQWTKIDQMRRVASQIARETMARGGLLFHGALAEYRGSGFIMAGPQEVGKSTASRRLPSPWRSLCDDMTLVVPDGKGGFWAHPWPTWSRFFYNGPGGSWPVEDAKPLRAVFFLDQAPFDGLEPIHGTQATALTLQSAEELTRELLLELTDTDSARALCDKALSVAKGLAATVPTYSLKLSLDGRFWEKIEGVLPAGDQPNEAKVEAKVKAGFSTSTSTSTFPRLSVDSLMADDKLRVVCTGTSMSPTLDEPDLLEVEPYGTARVRPGDVVCFKSRGTGKAVVHRVVRVEGRGTRDGGPKENVRTRGDNNPADDVGVLETGDIIGRVTTAQRGARRRKVHGGWFGLAVLPWARLGHRIRSSTGLLPHMLYHFLAGLGPFDRMLPASLRPRLVRFSTRYRAFLKLLVGRRTIGHYDFRHKEWHIRRPFRLLVDEQNLPVPRSWFPNPNPDD